MTELIQTPLRYVVRMTSPSGFVSELTSDLDRDQATSVVAVLRGMFTGVTAGAQGWLLVSVSGGFNASRGEISVSFTMVPEAAV